MTKHKQGPLVSSYSLNRVLFSWFKTCKFYEIWIFKEVQSCAWKKVFSWCEKWPWESGAWCVTSRYMWSLVRNVWALLSSHWSVSCSLGLWLVQGVTTCSVYLAAGVVRTLCCITFYMCAAPLEAQTGIIHYFVSFLDFSDICTCDDHQLLASPRVSQVTRPGSVFHLRHQRGRRCLGGQWKGPARAGQSLYTLRCG